MLYIVFSLNRFFDVFWAGVYKFSLAEHIYFVLYLCICICECLIWCLSLYFGIFRSLLFHLQNRRSRFAFPLCFSVQRFVGFAKCERKNLIFLSFSLIFGQCTKAGRGSNLNMFVCCMCVCVNVYISFKFNECFFSLKI